MPSRDPSQPLTAGIVGGGIAGLSAAVALRRAGLRVEVYERSRFGHEIGAAISTPPNATAALRRWGFDLAAADPVPNLHTRYAEAAHLRTVFESTYEDIEAAMGAPSLSFHRVDLHRGLRTLATEDERPDSGDGSGGGSIVGTGTPVAIHLGCEVRGVDCESGVLELADGRKVQKDLVIIADGAHSNLLTDFAGRPVPAQPTGRSIYRWLVSMDDVMADPELAGQYRDRPPGFLAWVDNAKRILWITYTCRGGRILNNAMVHDTEDHPSSPSSSSDTRASPSHDAQSGLSNDKRDSGEEDVLWHARAAKETVLKTISNFHPATRRIISMASEDGIRVHRLFRRPPLESFVRGRTAIIGDAAHVMLPTHAAGCAVAIESASVLEVLFKGLEGYRGSPTDGYDNGAGAGKKDAGGTEEGVNGGIERIVQERLQLFDKLRIPRCNLTMIVSNGGPEALRIRGVEEEIRRFYHGPLPPPEALPWSDEFREVLFHYDAFEAAKEALSMEEGAR
ncbi:putative beta-glucosidase-like protein [Rosellinia necatrix]|uniref:Putative beta-glucosidase-like protein n=1 Tax=Rosellinia necatrix TaxID=77044 RepID=A0A1W2TMQ0_ROSNE|nr:putative beta-glucosidase-like protein [Rosellinia necatrix]